jgi:hypothetical protein
MTEVAPVGAGWGDLTVWTTVPCPTVAHRRALWIASAEGALPLPPRPRARTSSFESVEAGGMQGTGPALPPALAGVAPVGLLRPRSRTCECTLRKCGFCGLRVGMGVLSARYRKLGGVCEPGGRSGVIGLFLAGGAVGGVAVSAGSSSSPSSGSPKEPGPLGEVVRKSRSRTTSSMAGTSLL